MKIIGNQPTPGEHTFIKQQFEYIIQDGDIVDNKVNVVIPKDYFPADEIYEVSVVVEYKNGVQTKPSNNVDLEIDTNSGTINAVGAV